MFNVPYCHLYPGEIGIEKTIFLRTSNRNSSMCNDCHTDKAGGAEKGNHPIGVIKTGIFKKFKIPKKLIAAGARVGEKKNQIICETCHTAHGSPGESLLIESAKNSGLCLECHGEKNIFTPEGKRQPFHVINAKSEKVKIPEELIKKGAKLGWNGEIICQTCHKIHNNKIEEQLLLIKKDEKSTLCLTCHTDKQYLADTKHNNIHVAPGEKNLEGKTVAESGICSACHLPHKAARKLFGKQDFTTELCLSCHRKGEIGEKAIPADYTHPINVRPYKEKSGLLLTTMDISKEQLTLPLFNKYGVHDTDGNITCTTCHDPHRWRADSTEGEIRKDIQGDRRTSFLRMPSPEICEECHRDKFVIANSLHDMKKTAPEEKNILGQTAEESGLCEQCHLVHGGQKAFLWAREITTKDEKTVRNLCINCHSEDGVGKKKVLKDFSHPIDISKLDKEFTTTLPLFDKDGKISDTGFITCQTCHDPHRWDPSNVISEDSENVEKTADYSFLRLPNYPSPKLCANCHADKVYIDKTDHDLLITAPASININGKTPAESGTCGVCHLAHNSKNSIRLWAQKFGKGDGIMDKMCNSCHSENGSAKNKVPKVSTHPKGQLIVNIGRNVKERLNYFPLFNLTTGKPETIGDIACASCHDVHQWSPRFKTIGKGVNVEGNVTNSFLRPQTYSLLCIDCHGFDALFRFKYYHDPKERRIKEPDEKKKGLLDKYK